MTFKIETVGFKEVNNVKERTLKVSKDDNNSITLQEIEPLVIKLQNRGDVMHFAVYGFNETETPRMIKPFGKPFNIDRYDKRYKKFVSEYKYYIIEIILR